MRGMIFGETLLRLRLLYLLNKKENIFAWSALGPSPEKLRWMIFVLLKK
jgi:hypothetical protein